MFPVDIPARVSVTFSYTVMNCLPPEILSLIVSEIWLSNDSLSSISLAVPSTTPFVREHRFKVLHVAPTWLKDLLDIIDGAQDVSKAIRKVTLIYELEDFTLFSRLLSAAVNLEKLVLRGTFTIDWTADLSNLSTSLRACTRLTSLCITEMAIPRLSDLFQVLHSVPNLTTLTLRWLEIHDMYDMMPPSWLSPPPENPFYRPQWDPDPQDFEAPKPLPRISHLTLQLTSRVWSLMHIDLISSAKTPFPNLQEIVFQDQFLAMYSPRRLPALLKRYRSSLRVLDLADGVEETGKLSVYTFFKRHQLTQCSPRIRTSRHGGAFQVLRFWQYR